jgi:cytochrome c2
MNAGALLAAVVALLVGALGCSHDPAGAGASPEPALPAETRAAVAAPGPSADMGRDSASAGPSADMGRDSASAGPSVDMGRDSASAGPSVDMGRDSASAGPSAGMGRDSASAGPSADTAAEPPGDVERGRALVAEFQCNRCHDGTGQPAAKLDAHCVHCHQEIAANRFQAPAATVARWQENLVQLREAPSLAAAGERLRPAWIRRFLLDPHDLRPRLHATMPRLAIAPDQARDIAAYLTRERHAPPAAPLGGASAEAGRALFVAKGCVTCHAFTGAAGLPKAIVPLKTMEKEVRSAAALAPDLRFVRARSEPGDVVAWLLDPQALKPDTLMPRLGLTPVEARDLAAFLIATPLAAPEPRKQPERLPVLTRRVAYEEVNRRVFRNTCRHCHSEPDYALGDGGPGNTGGFGFKPRGLNLASYEGIAAGYIEDHGERRSVFSPLPDGRPRLLASLLARAEEEAGRADPAVRGMPLGLPALGPEEIQLVESWIAQGRPQ